MKFIKIMKEAENGDVISSCFLPNVNTEYTIENGYITKDGKPVDLFTEELQSTRWIFITRARDTSYISSDIEEVPVPVGNGRDTVSNRLLLDEIANHGDMLTEGISTEFTGRISGGRSLPAWYYSGSNTGYTGSTGNIVQDDLSYMSQETITQLADAGIDTAVLPAEHTPDADII
jgi:hypothetical protein